MEDVIINPGVVVDVDRGVGDMDPNEVDWTGVYIQLVWGL